MTEAEWLTASEPFRLLRSLPDQIITERKLIFFALVCWLTSPDYFTTEGSDRLFIALEEYAEGKITRGELDDRFVREAIHDGAPFGQFDRQETELYLAGALEKRVDPATFAHLLRCIFGNPFRPVVFNPRWRTETAVALASALYEERAFDRLPILADALEEAGCDHADILAHCRGPGPHARGCWVVDGVLGKE